MPSLRRLWGKSGKRLKTATESEVTHEEESESWDCLCDTDIGGIARSVCGHHLSGAIWTTVCAQTDLSTASWRRGVVLHGQGRALDNQCYTADLPVFCVSGLVPKDEIGFHFGSNGVLGDLAFLRAVL